MTDGSFISTHSPRAGRTRGISEFRQAVYDFNSLAPCGANLLDGRERVWSDHFNSLAPCGANPDERYLDGLPAYFNSLAPCGANQRERLRAYAHRGFQLTRPVWGEPPRESCRCRARSISTHSPRVGRTARAEQHICHAGYFNSLAPCGANPELGIYLPMQNSFQLTRPVWGEPERDARGGTRYRDFNSLAPCGANLGSVVNNLLRRNISTHSPRAGRTPNI